MLNWPGAKGSAAPPASGARPRVNVSPVSRDTWRTRNGAGRIGSVAVSTRGSGLAEIEVQELELRRLEAPDRELGETLHQLVAQGRVRLALPPETGPVEGQGA